MSAQLISLNEVSKAVGSKTLFEGLNLSLKTGDALGIIGPNGAGKSTLIKIMGLIDTPDEGKVVHQKSLRISYVPQEEEFNTKLGVIDYLLDHLTTHKKLDLSEAQAYAYTFLGQFGFEDFDMAVSTLSGGWKKKLSLAKAFSETPDVLILDEPTNHLDWEALVQFEMILKSFNGSFIVISHDRSLLNNVTNKTLEINPVYAKGLLKLDVPYSEFLVQKKLVLDGQRSLQASLSSKAKREQAFLDAGVKARTTKSKVRTSEAHKLIDDLKALSSKNAQVDKKLKFQIDESGRKTKKLAEFIEAHIGYDSNTPLVKALDFAFLKNSCTGLLGPNGSGKTTLVKSLTGQLELLSGNVKLAPDLKLLYVEQKRDFNFDDNANLLSFISDGSEYVNFKNESIHVRSYLIKFGFSGDQMTQLLSRLSGGERAKLHLAKELLKPADILILDEPTNDLDISTIDFLEQLIRDFQGAVILISHDRFFLENCCSKYIGLRPNTTYSIYAELNNWLRDLSAKEEPTSPTRGSSESPLQSKNKKPKLSYNDKKFLEEVEDKIAEKETQMSQLSQKLEKAAQNQDTDQIQEVSQLIAKVQSEIDEVFKKWEKLSGQQ